jgi:hypothetical protein
LALFDSLIERLQDACIHRGDDIYRCIQFFVGHSRFPCIRKAPFHSRIAEAHHRHGKTDEHLLAFGETLDSMGVTIELAKISFLQFRIILTPPLLKNGKFLTLTVYPSLKKRGQGRFAFTSPASRRRSGRKKSCL